MHQPTTRPLTAAQKRHAVWQFGWLVSAFVATGSLLVVSQSFVVQAAAMAALLVAIVVTPLL